jgi:pimeloyl-ACP methyl ester carboxylesterase
MNPPNQHSNSAPFSTAPSPESSDPAATDSESPRLQVQRTPRVWIFLRGWSREAGHWGAFPQVFARALGDVVQCVDLPGTGSKWMESSPTTVAGQVQALRSSLEVIRLYQHPEQRLHLFAISFGSMVATHWAQHYPQEVAASVLLNPSFKGLSPWFSRLRPRALPGLVRAALTADLLQSETQILKQVSQAPGAIQAETAREWAGIRKARPISTLNSLRQLLAALRAGAPRAASLGEAAAAPSLPPTLILGSGGDRLVDSKRCSGDAARALGASLRMHPTAGHDLPLDEPEWVIAQVQDWLGSAERSL